MSAKGSFTFAIMGAGGRGNTFANWILQHPDAGRVVAVAEPDADRRRLISDKCQIKPHLQFKNWEDMLAQPKLADAIINTTMDRIHAPSSVKAFDLGYHMLLEKPMATTIEDCIAIDNARRKNNRIASVCHSMRYHVVYAELKKLLESGVIGKLIGFDQIEGVEYTHYSHSFVRGNWGNQSRSSFMLLSKSCHDVDILCYLVGRPCRTVASFGTLNHFKKDNAPTGAPPRCTDGCPAEQRCPYSTYKLYLAPDAPWRHAAWIGELSFEERVEVMKTSPYGRCVFQCDNDVVDHQVVCFEFEENITGTFTMAAFDMGHRRIRLHGSEGYIEATFATNTIDMYRFLDRKHDRITFPSDSGSHGGADDNIMANFIAALRADDPDMVLTTTDESLRTHTVTFAAELARRERRLVEPSELLPLEKQHQWNSLPANVRNVP